MTIINKKAIGHYLTNRTNIKMIDNHLKWKSGEFKHEINLVRNVKETTVFPYTTSLKNLSKYFFHLSNNSVDLLESNHKNFDACKKSMLAIIPAGLNGNGRKIENFSSRSLICFDIDNKYTNHININSVENKLKSIGLEYLIHSSVRHTKELPRFRVYVSIGMESNINEFKAATQYLANILNISGSDAFDDSSFKPVQLMFTPCGHIHIEPIVKYGDGKSLLGKYGNKLTSFMSSYKPASSKPKKNKTKPSRNVIKQSVQGDQLFLNQVDILHRKLVHHQMTGLTSQFYRNKNHDNNPGLFSYHDEKVIIDPSRTDIYKLNYSCNDFREADAHQLNDRQTIIETILKWESNTLHNYSLFCENCGSGKSEILGYLSQIDPNIQLRIFTFHTKSNRDAFYHKNMDNCVLVKGKGEIIGKHVNSKKRRDRINEFIDEHYKEYFKKCKKLTNGQNSNGHSTVGFSKYINNDILDHNNHDSLLDILISNSLITKNESNHIRKEFKKNSDLITQGKHLAMTTSKYEMLITFCEEHTFSKFITYTDETSIGMLTDIPENTVVKDVYIQTVIINNHDPIDHALLRKQKRCLVTSEQSIKYELEHLGMAYTTISEPSKTYDKGLEILNVSSTSIKTINKKATDADENILKTSNRSNIYHEIRKNRGKNINIIADGLSKHGCDLNFINNKGKNDLADKDLAIILSLACPKELATVMYCTGISEHYIANSIIMADKAVQSIGRNQGYRNRGGSRTGPPSTGDNKTLLIIPYFCDLDQMHNVTDICTSTDQWLNSSSSNTISGENKDKFYFRDDIEGIANITKDVNQKLTLTSAKRDDIRIDINKFGDFYINEHGDSRIPLSIIKDNLSTKYPNIKLKAIKDIIGNRYEIKKSRHKWSNAGSKQCLIYKSSNQTTDSSKILH